MVPDEVSAVMQKRKKVVTREIIMLSSFCRDGSFFISRQRKNEMEKINLDTY